MQKAQTKLNEYLSQLTELLGWAYPRLVNSHQLQFKPCFGAVAGYVRGNIFISCGTFGVALRLPSDVLLDLFNGDIATRLRYFRNGHIKTEYAVLSSVILDDRARFMDLLNKSLKYARSARPNDPKRKRRRSIWKFIGLAL